MQISEWRDLFKLSPTTSLFGDSKRVDRGYEASFVAPNEYGEIMPENIENEIKDTTAIASVIFINNEIGTISDIQSISSVCHQHNVAFH